ncbi:phage head closure protein [Priestia flexa]|uniref:phage head closure protein n=1 Tax=Priestia flexa TaxID=86664 RepID=UPI001CFCB91A|nr:phage head closure protein [Priestia flexa]
MFDEFPHNIIFQEEQPIPDGGGGHKKTWIDVLETEAFVCPISSREFYLAQQANTPIDYNVFYPYQAGVKPSMRIKWVEGHMDKYLSIKSKPIDQGGQGEILMIKCVES